MEPDWKELPSLAVKVMVTDICLILKRVNCFCMLQRVDIALEMTHGTLKCLYGEVSSMTFGSQPTLPLF